MLRSFLSSFLTNSKGITINDKIIVFESDDWGSIRMPNKKTFNKLKDFGIPVDQSPYCVFDTLENKEDLTRLFEVLGSHKNYFGNHPVFTANFVTANPDFTRIKENNFERYFFEPINKTYERYYNQEKDIFDLICFGIDSKIFIPQFHGRDHVNVPLWFKLLKTNKFYKYAFNSEMWGLSNDIYPNLPSIQATYDSSDHDYILQSLNEGLNLFNKLFGYNSVSFIPNNYIWSQEMETFCSDAGIKIIQGMKYQLLPNNFAFEKRKKIRHFFGQENLNNQFYNIRNCTFEPSLYKYDEDFLIKEIKNAFIFKKPAVINTHRINFSGNLDAKNRDKNLSLLDSLLKRILKIWPDVYFYSTTDLLNLFSSKS